MPEEECDHLCTGSDELCGGSWRNSVYEHVAVIMCHPGQEHTLARCLADCATCLAEPRNIEKLGVCVSSTGDGSSAVEIVTAECGDPILGGRGGGRGGGGH